nr:hypothetical protein BaRGS_009320 [Batillaria attramentaria]
MQNKDVAIGINVAGLAEYSAEVKWVDIAHESKEWFTQRPGVSEWDTHEHDKVSWRDDGYPASLPAGLYVGKTVYRGFGEDEEDGNYTILYDGEGAITFGLVQFHVRYQGKGRMVVEFPHIKDGGIFIKMTETNPANPVRNLRILPPGYENTYLRFPFHPLFLEFLKRFSEIRFMDYLHTNAHEPEPTTWSSVRPMDFHTQIGPTGGSIEYLVQLANTVGADPWVCMPHAADDSYVRHFANYVKQHLRPDLKVYVEYSNEVWNSRFRQTKYSQEMGKPMFPDDPDHIAGMKFFVKRATEVAHIWTQAWGTAKDRVVNVIAWQTANFGSYTRMLNELGSRSSNFQAMAITAYFNCDKVADRHARAMPNMTMEEIKHLCDTDLINMKNTFSHHMDAALSHGLKLLMYEGGPAIHERTPWLIHGDSAVTNKAIAFNEDPAIRQPVLDVLSAWYDIVTSNGSNSIPGGLFNYFSSTGQPSKYGSWGMAEYTGQDLSTNSHDHVTLDGIDPRAKKLYVRVTDTTDVITYHVYNDHSHHWTTMQNFQYYSEEYSTAVVPRFPTGLGVWCWMLAS